MTWIDSIGSIGPAPQHHLGGTKASKRLLSMADIRDANTVLVPGCGDGETAIAIASAIRCRVTATEVNPAAVAEAAGNVTRSRGSLVGQVDLVPDDLLKSRLAPAAFDRAIVESVLVMLPKQAGLRSIHSLLVPGGLLAMNEGLRMSGDASAMKTVEEEFARVGIDWNLPTYEEWREHLAEAGFDVLSDTSAVPFSLGLMGMQSFLRSPIGTTVRFWRTMRNRDARTFFRRVFRAMRKARLRWGYCLWLARKAA